MIAEVQQVLAQADCLYDRNRVQQAIAELAQQITHTLADSSPLVLCVMNGALVFAGELLPQLAFPLQVDYLHASRYREKLAGQFAHERQAVRAVLIFTYLPTEPLT